MISFKQAAADSGRDREESKTSSKDWWERAREKHCEAFESFLELDEEFAGPDDLVASLEKHAWKTVEKLIRSSYKNGQRQRRGRGNR